VNTEPQSTKAKVQSDEWELLEDDDSPIQVGQLSSAKLGVHFRHRETQQEKIFQYRVIDWNSEGDIRALRKWRYQKLRDHGFVTRKSTPFTEEESAWLFLFYEKMRAALDQGHRIEMPTVRKITDAFNNFFVGKTFKNSKGIDTPPRIARTTYSVEGRIKNSTLSKLRKDVLRVIDVRNGGIVYIPIITEEELRQYCDEEVVIYDNPEDKDKNAVFALSDKEAEYLSNLLDARRKRMREDKAETLGPI